MSKQCINCNKEVEPYHNYCSWECGIDLAKKEGGQVHTPNGLPIECIKYDGNMYEHEHGDHPDYKFPVTIEYIGPDPEHKFRVTDGEGTIQDMGAGWTEAQCKETHALIYTDGSIAITMYECCYAMWYLRRGECAGGSLWDKKEWRLTQESLEKIHERYPKPSD